MVFLAPKDGEIGTGGNLSGSAGSRALREGMGLGREEEEKEEMTARWE